MNRCHRFDQLRFQSEDDCEGEVLCLKIKTHLEELFSDSHLAEDGFLLKHVQKNKQGFVSLKLLTSLKKVQNTKKHLVLSVVFTFQQFE